MKMRGKDAMNRYFMLAAAVLVFAGCGQKQKQGTITLAKMSVPVTVAKAVNGQVSSVLHIGGSIKAFKELDIVPDIPGRLAQVLVKEGDVVKKGQVLAVLDTSQARIQLQQVDAAVQAAQAQFENAKHQLTRTSQLFKRGAVTKQQMDGISAAFKAAKAGLARAKAARALAMHAIKVSTMYAPFDGVITGRFKDPGDIINPLMQSLSPLKPNAVVRLARLDKVLVDGFVSDRDWSWLHKGLPVRVTVDAWPGMQFDGVLTKVEPAADALSRTFPIEVTVANKGLKLRPGMYARVILTRDTQRGVVVPLDALVRRDNRFIVFTAGQGRAHLHQVKVGLQTADKAVILKGIKAGDRVVVQGNIALREGTPIRVIGQGKGK